MAGFEASPVIATRLAKVYRGGAQADRGIELVASDKIETGHELQSKLSRLGAGAARATAVATGLKHYRGKVAASRRRLGGWKLRLAKFRLAGSGWQVQRRASGARMVKHPPDLLSITSVPPSCRTIMRTSAVPYPGVA